MNRESTQPHAYASLADLQHALLVQVRRFRRACAETATTISMDGGKKPAKPALENADELTKLELMHDQVTLLRNMSGQLLVNFPGVPRAVNAKRQVDGLVSDIQSRLDVMKERMSSQSRGRGADPVVANRNNALIRELEFELGHNVGHLKGLYVAGDTTLPGVPGPTACDVAYVHITDLRGTDGFVHPNYYVMTAHPRATEDARRRPIPPGMWVATSPEFRVPRRIHWDAQARTPAELRKLVVDMMTRDGAIGRAVMRDIPVARDRIKFAHDNVRSTGVQGDTVSVRVRDKNDLDDTALELRQQLESIVRHDDPKNRDVIRMKLERDTGTIKFIFSLPGKLRGRVVSNTVLMDIRRLLNLNDAATQRVKTALEDPE